MTNSPTATTRLIYRADPPSGLQSFESGMKSSANAKAVIFLAGTLSRALGWVLSHAGETARVIGGTLAGAAAFASSVMAGYVLTDLISSTAGAYLTAKKLLTRELTPSKKTNAHLELSACVLFSISSAIGLAAFALGPVGLALQVAGLVALALASLAVCQRERLRRLQKTVKISHWMYKGLSDPGARTWRDCKLEMLRAKRVVSSWNQKKFIILSVFSALALAGMLVVPAGAAAICALATTALLALYHICSLRILYLKAQTPTYQLLAPDYLPVEKAKEPKFDQPVSRSLPNGKPNQPAAPHHGTAESQGSSEVGLKTTSGVLRTVGSLADRLGGVMSGIYGRWITQVGTITGSMAGGMHTAPADLLTGVPKLCRMMREDHRTTRSKVSLVHQMLDVTCASVTMLLGLIKHGALAVAGPALRSIEWVKTDANLACSAIAVGLNCLSPHKEIRLAGAPVDPSSAKVTKRQRRVWRKQQLINSTRAAVTQARQWGDFLKLVLAGASVAQQLAAPWARNLMLASATAMTMARLLQSVRQSRCPSVATASGICLGEYTQKAAAELAAS
ncbi:MAG: hypothetical protein ACOYKZ_02585 [Chlamydiia bacterium]